MPVVGILIGRWKNHAPFQPHYDHEKAVPGYSGFKRGGVRGPGNQPVCREEGGDPLAGGAGNADAGSRFGT